MPALSGNAATYRAGRYFAQGYIGTIPLTVALSRAVNMATITYPVTTITFDNPYSGSGSTANVKEGMTVVVYSGNTSTIKGYLRVAAGGTSATVLQVNEFSAGTVNLADNDKFDVLETYSIWDKLVSATAALNKDSRTAYSSQNANPPPIANCGGLDFGFVDDGQVYRTVTFEANVSINVDPDSTTSKTYLWSVGDGTIVSGSTTTSAITVRFPVGFRHVQLTVTDSGNAQATVRQIPVRVFNRTTTLPLAPSEVTLDYTQEDGWSARFQLPKGSESAISTLPDGALIVYFEDEYYAGTRVSYGSNVSGRSHIKFVGYLVRDTVSIDPDDNTVSFEALSPLGILNRTPALTQLMVNTTGNGTLWRHVKTLNTNRMYWYLSHWHSTLDSYFDFVWTLDGTILTYRRVAVSEVSSIGAQLRDIAQSVNALVTCDRLGRILMIRDFNYLSSANRALRTLLYALTTADMMRFEFPREHRGTVKYVEGQGITDGTAVSSNKPIYSSGPGKAPAAFGTSSETLARQIVDDQTDLNTRTGFHFAKVNGLYLTSTYSRFVPQGATLQLPDGYDWIDPAYNEPFTITLPTTTNRRAVAYDTSTYWIPDAISVTLDAETGGKEITVTLSHETNGVAGVTKVKPQQSENGLPSFPPIDLAIPPIVLPTVTTPLHQGTGTLAMFLLGSNTIKILTNANNPSYTGGPTVTSVGLSMNGVIVHAIADPWSPLYIGTGSTVNGWIATTTRLYKIDDIFGARTLTQLLVFSSAVGSADGIQRVIAIERAVQNFVLVASYLRSSGGVTIARSTDGTTFTEATLTAHYNDRVPSVANNVTPTLWVSGKIPGRAYAFAFNNTGNAQAAASSLYQTDDYGANWYVTSYATNAQALGYCLHFPWHDNPDDRYFYWTKSDAALSSVLMRSDRVLGTQTNVDPSEGLNKSGSFPHPAAIDSCVFDRRSLVLAGAHISTNFFATTPYGTRDGGNNWLAMATENLTNNDKYMGFRFAPDSNSQFYGLGEDTRQLMYSSDFGGYIDARVNATAATVAIIGG